MILTMEYVVTYKDAPKEPQQRATFKNKETALAFAYAVENDGGIAVFTSGFKSSHTGNAPPYLPTPLPDAPDPYGQY